MSSSQSAFADIVGRFRERIGRQARSIAPSILQYDPIKKDLCLWLWPLYANGQRVEPKDLSAHRKTHVFYAPSCLCAFLDDRTVGREEAGFYSDEDGSFRIACATNRCRYSVGVSKIYMSPSLPVKMYGVRATAKKGQAHDENRPHHPGNDGTGLWGVPLAYRQPMQGPPTIFALLMQLDDPSVPGLPDDVFSKLFIQCRVCHWLMTANRFPRHTCLVPPAEMEEVLDLTGEDSDSDSDDEMAGAK